MTPASRLADRVRRGERLPWWVDIPLMAAVPFFQLGMSRRLRQPAERVTAYVISFGNVTAGGTGKTPAVIERARVELGEGRKVGVLTRGYHAPAGPGPAVSAEVDPRDWYRVLGDEAALILRKAPGAIVFKNRDRNAAAQRAIHDYNCGILILDDGYQYTTLERDENVLLIDAANPFGSGLLMPRGLMREPLDAISRATAVTLTRCDQSSDLEGVVAAIRRVAPDVPIRKTIHSPVGLRRLVDGEKRPLEELRGARVSAVCAIGRPEAFYGTIEGLGATIVERVAMPDHRELRLSPTPGNSVIVMTEKDAIRLENPPDGAFALEIELRDVDV